MSEASGLLALIHGDGGHYEEKHGTAKACQDAVELMHTKWVHNEHMTDINELSRRNNELVAKLRAVISATEDKNGQFKAWHDELRKTTNEAKETLNQKYR